MKATAKAASNGQASFQELGIKSINPSPTNPRRFFDDAQLDELAASIKQQGVLEPVLVRQKGKSFELIAGERRWRAAKKAKLTAIPGLVRSRTILGHWPRNH